MTEVLPNGALAQHIWNSTVTLMAENEFIAPRLYRTDGKGVIQTEDRQGEVDVTGDRGSDVTFWFADRRHGQDIAPRALGSTVFGQSAPQRPVWSQTIAFQAQELATAGFRNLEVGQQYTNVPIERLELHAAGAEAAELTGRSIYYWLAGITAYNSTGTLWPISPLGNAVSEMDAAHQFWTGSHTSDTDVAADTGSLLTMEGIETVITRLQSKASGVLSPLAPAETPWGKWFIVAVDSEGAEQLTRYSSSNRINSLTLSEIQGGNAPDKVASYMRANSGFAGTRNTLVLIDDYTPFGQSGTTQGLTTAGTQIGHVRRAMILGRGAMRLIWGAGFDAQSSHIKATFHRVHEYEEWKFLTHWAGAACIPSNAPTPQRMGCATLSYYVTAATPIY